MLQKFVSQLKQLKLDHKYLFRGVKESQKAFRKNKQGIIILAKNTYPVDIISQFPAMCEEYRASYIFMNKQKLKEACGNKNSATVVYIKPFDEKDLSISDDLRSQYSKIQQKCQKYYEETVEKKLYMEIVY